MASLTFSCCPLANAQEETRCEVCCAWHYGWLRSKVVERQSLTGELSLSCTRPAADG